MDAKTVHFLTEAGLERYVKVFQHNKIGIEEVGDIPDEILRVLIPPYGDVLRYKKALARHIANPTTIENIVEDVVPPDEISGHQDPLSSVDISAGEDIDEKSENFQFCKLDKANAFCRESSDTLELELASYSILLEDDGSLLPLNNNEIEKNVDKPSANGLETRPEEPPRKKVKLQSDGSRDSFPTTSVTNVSRNVSGTTKNHLESKEDLEAFLRTCYDGQQILSTFEKLGKLTESMRRKLTAATINHMVTVHGIHLKNSQYNCLAKIIVETFPTESLGAYYIPPFSEGPQQTVSKGKLPYRLRNLKVSMKEKGVPTSEFPGNQVLVKKVTPANLLSEQDFTESKVWLKSYSEPWTEVLERWTQTAPNRVSEFSKCNNVSVNDILTQWPLYKHPLGYTLVAIDFKILFPEKGLELLNNWPICRDKLLAIVEERSKRDKLSVGYQILKSLPANPSEESKNIVATYLLPTLLQPSLIREKGKKSWKPTIGEAQESFIIYAKDSVTKQICLKQRKNKYEKLMRPIQPCVIVVGETIYDATDFYVLYESVEYRMSNIIAAVDTCFKIIFVMNLEYPPESYNTWSFIQRYCYKLSVKNEKVPTCVQALISEL